MPRSVRRATRGPCSAPCSWATGCSSVTRSTLCFATPGSCTSCRSADFTPRSRFSCCSRCCAVRASAPAAGSSQASHRFSCSRPSSAMRHRSGALAPVSPWGSWRAFRVETWTRSPPWRWRRPLWSWPCPRSRSTWASSCPSSRRQDSSPSVRRADRPSTARSRPLTGAYLATAPILAASFGRLAPIGLLANLVAAPLCAACLGTGAAAVVAFRACPWPAARPQQRPRTCRWRRFLPHRASPLPFPAATFAWPNPDPALVVSVRRLSARRVAVGLNDIQGAGRALTLASALTSIALHLGPPPPEPGPARVDVIDVGQGLAVAMRARTAGSCSWTRARRGGGDSTPATASSFPRCSLVDAAVSTFSRCRTITTITQGEHAPCCVTSTSASCGSAWAPIAIP